MTTERIKEIQSKTAYPESVSVQQALLQVWNEVKQEQLRLHDVSVRSEQLVICKKCGSSEMYQYTKTKDKCEDCGNIQDY